MANELLKSNLQSKDKAELITLAKTIGEKGYSNLNKEELILKILKTNEKDKLMGLIRPPWWKKYQGMLAGITIASFIVGVASLLLPSYFGVTAETINDIDKTIVIRVEGIGGASKSVENAVLRERSAILAAETDAKRKVAEWLKGADIDAVTVVNQGEISTDVIKTVVRGKVPGTNTIKKVYDPESATASVIVEFEVKNNKNEDK